MKNKYISIGGMTLSLLAGGVAQAQNLLTDPGFESGTGTFNSDGSGIGVSDLGQWYGFAPKWQSRDGATAKVDVSDGSCGPAVAVPPPFPAGWSGDNFAQYKIWQTRAQGPQCDVNDKLMQGVSGASIGGTDPLVFSFDYINNDVQGSGNGFYWVCGISAAQTVPLFFAGGDCAGSNNGATTIDSGSLAQTSKTAWSSFSKQFTLGGSTYEAIVAVIKLGGRVYLAGDPDKEGSVWGVDEVYLGPPNNPPDCSAAYPSVDTLWPPNHMWVDINVLGVTDPDGDPTTVTIDSIYQDEPVNGSGDGNTSPDGVGVGTDTASVRSERAGNRNGRVYTIAYTAEDGKGGACTGDVEVSVPKSKGKKGAAVDDGPNYDSTAI